MYIKKTKNKNKKTFVCCVSKTHVYVHVYVYRRTPWSVLVSAFHFDSLSCCSLASLCTLRVPSLPPVSQEESKHTAAGLMWVLDIPI